MAQRGVRSRPLLELGCIPSSAWNPQAHQAEDGAALSTAH